MSPPPHANMKGSIWVVTLFSDALLPTGQTKRILVLSEERLLVVCLDRDRHMILAVVPIIADLPRFTQFLSPRVGQVVWSLQSYSNSLWKRVL